MYNAVNSKIFARVLFPREFAYAKFREQKPSRKWQNHSVVTDIRVRRLLRAFSIAAYPVCWDYKVKLFIRYFSRVPSHYI